MDRPVVYRRGGGRVGRQAGQCGYVRGVDGRENGGRREGSRRKWEGGRRSERKCREREGGRREEDHS